MEDYERKKHINETSELSYITEKSGMFRIGSKRTCQILDEVVVNVFTVVRHT
jgi:hypothetical protein